MALQCFIIHHHIDTSYPLRSYTINILNEFDNVKIEQFS